MVKAITLETGASSVPHGGSGLVPSMIEAVGSFLLRAGWKAIRYKEVHWGGSAASSFDVVCCPLRV